MDIREALEDFAVEMLTKFLQRSGLHENDATVVTSGAIFDRASMVKHFYEELLELTETDEGTSDQQGELIDVANMCFLLWWNTKDSIELEKE